MQNTPLIKTERLILRKFTKDDIEALFNILKDVEVNTYLPWFPLRSIEETKIFYENNYLSIYNQDKGYTYAICLKEDNYPIGYINIDTNEPYDLWYGLRKEFWHKKITTEAAFALLKQAKKDGIPYITATHDKNNIRSGKVMQKIGMKYCYSYEEQWQPKNFPVIFRMYQINLNINDDYIYQGYWNKSNNHFIEKL